MALLQEVSVSDFQNQVLSSSIPVIVEFGAQWCAPCKRLEPLLEQLGAQWAGRVSIRHINVDEAAELAMQYQVMSVPTTILFKGGQAVERLAGLQTKDRMIEKFLPHL